MMRLLNPGERVRVAAIHPPGHRRTPYYIRGKEGVIERACGPFANPEELGHGFDGLPKKHLYRVRFRQVELWDQYEGAETDTVDVDVYEHWLSPVAAEPKQEQQA
jgi:hypothetical protein